MKIAQVAPLFEAVPPLLYGGTERVIAHLTDSLVELGHEVTLFASASSRTRAELIPVREQAIRLDPTPLRSELAAHLAMLAEVRRHADRFDVIHFHTDMIHFPLFEDIAGRTITTLHGRLDIADLPDVYRRWANYPLVSISDNQRRALPFANWIGTVHHGMPVDRSCVSMHGQGYLAFLGRFSPEKRPDRAIAIAKLVGKPLKMAAKVDPSEVLYFNEQIRPLLMDQNFVEFIGEIGEDRKAAFLGGADALLFPIDWPEPFGLVMIEALSCGTPVIAYPCGSVTEVIEHNVTGYIVNSEEEAAEAIRNLDKLDRGKIRERFEQRFSALAMAKNYISLYAQQCSRNRKETPVLLRAWGRSLPAIESKADKISSGEKRPL